MLLDLRSKGKGIEYLSASFWGSSTVGLQQKGRSVANEEHIIENAETGKDVHRIKVEGRSQMLFWLVFRPTTPGFYEFLLPLYLDNHIRNQALNRLVTCLCE